MDEIKVFLVEDEIIIRDGIKKSIDWHKHGYRFVGEASDGELAYPMILKEKPDILITDIKMPFMDGLELSSLVKRELPNIKILILSGYDEFDYAKTSIRIGVNDYLLKPVSSVKLLKTLGEISDIVRQEREEEDLKKRYYEEMKENTEYGRMRLFSQMILGELSMTEMLDVGRKYGLNLSASCYEIMLFKILTVTENRGYQEKLVEACNAVEEEVLGIPYVCRFQRDVEGWAFLLLAEDESQMKQNEAKFVKKLHTVMKNWERLEYFGGIGRPVTRIRNLGQSYREADTAFAARFTMEPRQIVSLHQVQSASASEQLQVQGFAEIGKSREMIEKFLNSGTKDEVESFFEAYIARMATDDFRSTLVRQYIVMDSYFVIMSFYEKLAVPDENFQRESDQLQSIIQKLHSLSEIRRYMIELLANAIEYRDKVSGRRYSDIIVSAQEMIAQKYMTEDISLNSVAVNVGMSPSYFSSVFRKEVGKTFVEYLTDVRIEKSKELLMCTSMKTSEIGFEVGYKDPHYFSYIFKKTQGCPPKEYRARRKE